MLYFEFSCYKFVETIFKMKLNTLITKYTFISPSAVNNATFIEFGKILPLKYNASNRNNNFVILLPQALHKTLI